MVRNILFICIACIVMQCKNAADNQTKSITRDSSTNDTSAGALLALKEKASSEKEQDSLGTIVSKINFKVKTDSLADYPDGYIPWIDIEYPEKEIKNLLDKDKVMIEDSVVTIIIDYPLNIEYRGELKSKNGFTKQQLIRLISAHYHKIYEEEELTASIKTVPIKKRTKMYNRNQTNGKYGIWGHDLADLALDEILVYRNAEGHLTLSLNMES
jgi:hypothetical protein